MQEVSLRIEDGVQTRPRQTGLVGVAKYVQSGVLAWIPEVMWTGRLIDAHPATGKATPPRSYMRRQVRREITKARKVRPVVVRQEQGQRQPYRHRTESNRI